MMRLPLSAVKIGFICLLLAEIALFIIIGKYIGVLPTLALILLSSAAGLAILRGEARLFISAAMAAAQGRRLEMNTAGRRLVSCLAALLLILPGFLSSALGLILLIPPLQKLLSRHFPPIISFRNRFYAENEDAPANAPQPPILELKPEDYHARDPENSPWRQP